ncbi:MAG: hypothetical protein HYX48_00325 [Chlamydiales bacterium]|nr:hypothetical protein [Chlamydiales bacterium]
MKRFLILALALSALSSELMSNDLSWNSPVTVSTAGVDASDPNIVMDPSGNATAAWVEGGFVKASSQPVGGSWSALTTLSGSGASLPKLGIDTAGNVTAIWLEGGIVKTAALPFGGSWSVASNVSGIIGAASDPRLAVDSSGNAVAAWVKGGLIEVSKKPFGGSWSLVNTFSLNPASDNPKVAIGGGRALVTWHAVSSGQDQILASTSTVAGSWGTVQNLIFAATAGHNHNYPRGAMDTSGNARVIWFRSDLSGSDYINDVVISSSLLSGAASWDTPVQLSNVGMRNPSELINRIAFDQNGNAIAVWTSSTDGSTFNVESTVVQHGGVLNNSTQVAGNNKYAFSADLAVNSLGCALIPVMVFDGTNSSIFAQETDFGGFEVNVFTDSALISTGADNAYPRAATGYSAGTVNAAVAWINFDGAHKVIQIATGTKPIVAPPTGLGVVQGSSNFGVFTEYYNTFTWTASTDPNLTGYVFYRDGVLFATAGPTDTQIVDHNRVQNGAVTYSIAAFDNRLIQSPIVSVSFP